MAPEAMAIQVQFRWWLRHYLTAVILASWLTGMEPNMERVGWWIERGLRLRVVRLRALVEA